MRLTKNQLTAITESFTEIFLPTDHLWLFGSRTDDTQRGGDIDLYIETHELDVAHAQQKRRLLSVAIQRRIGEQKIDIVLNILIRKQSLPVYTEAKNTGILLV